MTKKRFAFGALLLVVALALTPKPSQAATVSYFVSGCTTGCFGLTFTLTITGTPGSGGPFVVSLNMSGTPTAALSAAGITRIGNVEFKIGTSASTTGLTAAPGTTAHWSTGAGPLAAGGCLGNNGDFVCSTQDFSVAPVSSGTPVNYTWTWGGVSVTEFAGLFSVSGSTEVHIGARWIDDLGAKKNGILSETAVIPEPTSMLLFGSGLLGLAGVVRRRMSK